MASKLAARTWDFMLKMVRWVFWQVAEEVAGGVVECDDLKETLFYPVFIDLYFHEDRGSFAYSGLISRRSHTMRNLQLLDRRCGTCNRCTENAELAVARQKILTALRVYLVGKMEHADISPSPGHIWP